MRFLANLLFTLAAIQIIWILIAGIAIIFNPIGTAADEIRQQIPLSTLATMGLLVIATLIHREVSGEETGDEE